MLRKILTGKCGALKSTTWWMAGVFILCFFSKGVFSEEKNFSINTVPVSKKIPTPSLYDQRVKIKEKISQKESEISKSIKKGGSLLSKAQETYWLAQSYLKRAQSTERNLRRRLGSKKEAFEGVKDWYLKAASLFNKAKTLYINSRPYIRGELNKNGGRTPYPLEKWLGYSSKKMNTIEDKTKEIKDRYRRYHWIRDSFSDVIERYNKKESKNKSLRLEAVGYARAAREAQSRGNTLLAAKFYEKASHLMKRWHEKRKKQKLSKFALGYSKGKYERLEKLAKELKKTPPRARIPITRSLSKFQEDQERQQRELQSLKKKLKFISQKEVEEKRSFQKLGEKINKEGNKAWKELKKITRKQIEEDIRKRKEEENSFSGKFKKYLSNTENGKKVWTKDARAFLEKFSIQREHLWALKAQALKHPNENKKYLYKGHDLSKEDPDQVLADLVVERLKHLQKKIAPKLFEENLAAFKKMGVTLSDEEKKNMKRNLQEKVSEEFLHSFLGLGARGGAASFYDLAKDYEKKHPGQKIPKRVLEKIVKALERAKKNGSAVLGSDEPDRFRLLYVEKIRDCLPGHSLWIAARKNKMLLNVDKERTICSLADATEIASLGDQILNKKCSRPSCQILNVGASLIKILKKDLSKRNRCLGSSKNVSRIFKDARYRNALRDRAAKGNLTPIEGALLNVRGQQKSMKALNPLITRHQKLVIYSKAAFNMGVAVLKTTSAISDFSSMAKSVKNIYKSFSKIKNVSKTYQGAKHFLLKKKLKEASLKLASKSKGRIAKLFKRTLIKIGLGGLDERSKAYMEMLHEVEFNLANQLTSFPFPTPQKLLSKMFITIGKYYAKRSIRELKKRAKAMSKTWNVNAKWASRLMGHLDYLYALKELIRSKKQNFDNLFKHFSDAKKACVSKKGSLFQGKGGISRDMKLSMHAVSAYAKKFGMSLGMPPRFPPPNKYTYLDPLRCLKGLAPYMKKVKGFFNVLGKIAKVEQKINSGKDLACKKATHVSSYENGRLSKPPPSLRSKKAGSKRRGSTQRAY